MKIDKTFGKCLNSLLSILGISGNKLSKAINVDSSLVSRWINGKRIPAYDTAYVKNIAAYLSKNIKNSFQQKQIDELFKDICEKDNSIDSIEKKIEKILLESQGYSIESKRKIKECNYNTPIDNSKISNYPLEFSNENKIIFGVENIFSEVIDLLKSTVNSTVTEPNTIYITFYDNTDSTVYHYEKLVKCKNILLKSIQKGWKIVFLFNLDKEIKRIAKIIDLLIPLIQTGNIDIYYFNEHNPLVFSNEKIIVPKLGALSCFIYNQCPNNTCAFYFKYLKAVDILEKNFNILLSTYTKPLIRYYSSQNKLEYGAYLTKIEEKIGNRFLFKYCFSILTLPKSLYKRLLTKKGLSKEEADMALKFYENRLNAFFENLQYFYYNDIYHIDCINDLIKHHQIYFYDYTGVEKLNLKTSEVIELLQNIICLLKSYEKYNIAFISGNNQVLTQNKDFCCLVKERQAVMLENLSFSNSVAPVKLSIKEPIMIKAFEEYFKDLMAKISPVNKDKNEIILWIKKQIYLLENSNNHSS